jgi:copper chaperone CopZ
MKGIKLYASIGLAVLALVVSAWFLNLKMTSSANAALAEFQIEKMTCGSCVGKIETALSSLDGFGSIEINLTSNRGRVTYDPEQLDSQVIAETITTAGYPAKLRLELDASEYLALQQEQAQLGQEYLARIGDRLLARTDFEALVEQRSSGAVPASQGDQLWKTVWQEVLQRELLLSAAEKNQVIIQDGEVDARLDELRQGHQGLDDLLAKRYGSVDAFRVRLHEDMIINRNIEDYVYVGIDDPRKQQEKLQQWYAELQDNTEVVVFDQRLKKISSSSGGGGGGGCCG